MSDEPKRLSQYPYGRLLVACDVCDRQGLYSVARLAARYGPEVDLASLLILLTGSCRWQRGVRDRPPRQYQQRCRAYLPHIVEPIPRPSGRPKLRVVTDDD